MKSNIINALNTRPPFICNLSEWYVCTPFPMNYKSLQKCQDLYLGTKAFLNSMAMMAEFALWVQILKIIQIHRPYPIQYRQWFMNLQACTMLYIKRAWWSACIDSWHVDHSQRYRLSPGDCHPGTVTHCRVSRLQNLTIQLAYVSECVLCA